MGIETYIHLLKSGDVLIAPNGETAEVKDVENWACGTLTVVEFADGTATQPAPSWSTVLVVGSV